MNKDELKEKLLLLPSEEPEFCQQLIDMLVDKLYEEDEKNLPLNWNGAFLKHNAEYSEMFLLARDTVSDESRQAEVHQKRLMGYGVISLYPWIQFDYGGNHKFRYDRSQKEYVDNFVKFCLANNVVPIFWLMEDEQGFDYFDRDSQELFDNWALFLNDIVVPNNLPMVVLGLEAREYWSDKSINNCGNWLKTYYPDLLIGFHTLPNDLTFIDAPWVDAFLYQTGFKKPTETQEQFSSRVLADVAHIANIIDDSKMFIVAEYDKSSETPEAEQLGDEFLKIKNVSGVWNGCTINNRTRDFSDFVPYTPIPEEAVVVPPTNNSPVLAPHEEVKSYMEASDIWYKFNSVVNSVHNPSDWAETIRLDNVEIKNNRITFAFHKDTPWYPQEESGLVGNLWMVQDIGGLKYATPFEWLRPNQNSKEYPTCLVGEGHLEKPLQFNKGEKVGFFITTPARRWTTTTKERSNIILCRLV